ncbi:hypothetical protein [Methylobacterium haplocladii]|uniref:Uncharacterized protein n=1 Tax=Methylobacterium haplocladii TaxID=1176176 RepID=A0A512IRJ8_9HYPH|nr:hypothetical protein [Methylobacterium haplocladii]GEP00306.1 hypothetical protein MHA02_26930 [Methylobacterium haplocladii]GJD86077.1 hypothetical protein HPGCJGGD_3974 [Methylobacterium haplocladii]GLS59796.1 hypothetical protein GCM10007887_24690 [Methylobacterium haplocladii]
MRTLTVVALSALTLAGSIAGAEARGFRLRGSGFAIPHRSATARVTTTRPVPTIATVGAIGLFDPTRPDASIVTRSVMTAGATDETSPIPPMPPVPAAVKKSAEPWCPSGRIAGAGTGFCLIN